MVQFCLLLRSQLNLVRAFDNLGLENYYLDDILKSRRYHSKALLDSGANLSFIQISLKQRAIQEKLRIKNIFARKPPLFKLELI
mgnify:FL=1